MENLPEIDGQNGLHAGKTITFQFITGQGECQSEQDPQRTAGRPGAIVFIDFMTAD